MENAFDIVIRNGTVIDGTGTPGRISDLAIRGDKIAFVGRLEQGRERREGLSLQGCPTIIDATGLVVAPGLIDIHSHSDFLCLVSPRSESKVLDGVTTEVCGNCGSSPFPLSKETLKRKQEGYSKYGLVIDWQDADGFFTRVESQPSSINRGFLVGHSSIRDFVIGYDRRSPTDRELSEMRDELTRAMGAGALGLSSGLIYPPGCYASREELIEICREVSRLGGVYATHMRSEGKGLLEAVKEAIEVSRRTRVSLQISHIKTAGRENWSKLGSVKELLDLAIAEGLDVSCDRYPYVAAATDLNVILPNWAQEGGMEKQVERLTSPRTRKRIIEEILDRSNDEWYGESIVISDVHASSPSYKAELIGKTLAELSGGQNKSPVELALDLLVEQRGRVWILAFSMCEENLEEILRWDFVSIGSDSSLRAREGLLGQGRPHPRTYGTFSRVLGRYSRDRGILSLEEAVHRITGLSARKMRLDKRGEIREGYFADIAVFDPRRVTDRATYQEPHQYSTGIEYVIVNGCITVEKGSHNGAMEGKVLRRR
ncbi:MAG: amidohydrolase family protein [Candidatus Brocadiales bacterium]